jgi:hypothetical protein
MHLERLLVSLVGHMTKGVRERATVLLNMLYDGTDWQLVFPALPSPPLPSPPAHLPSTTCHAVAARAGWRVFVAGPVARAYAQPNWTRATAEVCL